MKLRDPMHLRSWQYVAVCSDGTRSQRYTINEDLTGAVLGNQRPYLMNFRTASLIVRGWNKDESMKYYLVIPICKD